MADTLSGSAFLSAEWRHLVMVNYAVDPAILAPYIPAGTVLDVWGGTTYVSVVAFMFLDTRVLGLPIPGHRNFEEVNLRFYVRRPHPDGDRRGVVFIKELVPRFMIAATARWVYHENYVSVPMSHHIEGAQVEYAWELGGRTHRVQVTTEGEPEPLLPGSEPEFIAEHYWGYARQQDGGTVEYQVAHPPWRASRVASSEIDIDGGLLYGPEFAAALAQPPRSVFLAEGSAIAVGHGTRLPE